MKKSLNFKSWLASRAHISASCFYYMPGTSKPVDSAPCTELNLNVSTCTVQSTIHTWYSRPCDNFALFSKRQPQLSSRTLQFRTFLKPNKIRTAAQFLYDSFNLSKGNYPTAQVTRPGMCSGLQQEIIRKETVLNNFTAKSRHILQLRSLKSGGGIETSHGLDGPGFDLRWHRYFYLTSKTTRQALGPIQPPIQWVNAARVRSWPLIPSSEEMKNE